MYIGIDLGTSNSAIAGVREGTARVFRPVDGGEVLPSAIYIDKRGHRLYGRRAYDQALMSPENVATGFKRLMGSASTLDVSGQSLSPEECSAEIIRQLIGQVTTELGEEEFPGVVIAIPAAFNQMQSEATLRAAKMAGLDKVDLVQEPVAAALAAMADAKRSGKFLIYDLGGGTFDVALIESSQGEVSILAQAGVNMLGGRDFDRMLVSEVIRPWLLANFDLPDNFLRDRQFFRLARVAQLAAERAKIELSTKEEASIFASDDEVRLTDESETEIFLDAPVTRSQFEELIRQSIQHTIDLVRNLLQEHEVEPAEVDRIVFIGGPSRIPLVRRMVTEALGIVADMKVDPMTAVAEGAAYYCENRLWKAPDQDKKPSTSEPKPSSSHVEMAEEPGIHFDYESRTADEKAEIKIRVAKDQEISRRIRLMTEGWDSGMLSLSDGMDIEVPLQIVGENVFDVHVMDSDGGKLEDHAEKIRITRLVATASSVPAAHSMAVKVRKSVESEENSFEFLVKQGDKLPASGQLSLRSGTNLKGGGAGHIGFEVFQVEYPDRVDLNLCVGMFRIEGVDVPVGQMIRVGDPIVFDWQMSEGGVLQASVSLPSLEMALPSYRFYAPQAGEMSFNGQDGVSFARSVLSCAQDEWGDLAAAIGPMAGPEIMLLKSRLDEQGEILDEYVDDPDTVRRVCEEARFIRQDTVRLGRKHMGALLQRQLGKIQAAFNRTKRNSVDEEEARVFEELGKKTQKIIDADHEPTFAAAQHFLADMRRIFFTVAWRDPAYVWAWFRRLERDSWLYADREEYEAFVQEGRALQSTGDQQGLQELVKKMLDARVSLGASDVVSELATIVRA
jgi:molecular chaperone DnaK